MYADGRLVNVQFPSDPESKVRLVRSGQPWLETGMHVLVDIGEQELDLDGLPPRHIERWVHCTVVKNDNLTIHVRRAV